MDPNLWLTSHTRQQAINFFAQYGSHTPIKFVHLVKAQDDNSVHYRPYDLTVVNPRDCGSDYYTMSAAGEGLRNTSTTVCLAGKED